ncbi:Glutathione S-transferase DHAR3 chloroplastic [Taenia crassiceps]|uniref:Glutathione S-transferase DHAR3 chloroplastic n=1 Tax=Taenia crassiceps TaxID=6207 RepID=A0ABR4Q3R2_9CEST
MLHLKQGDPEPVVNPDKFTLYDFKFCPFCQRVRYTLDYHRIPYDRVLVNLINKPDWFLRLHPESKVPLLRFRGERLVESDLVMRFVDQFNGEPETSLLRVCGEEAFRNSLSLSAELARPRFRVAYCLDASAADVDEFVAACGKIEAAIKQPYLCGDKVSLADLALVPFLNYWHYTMQRLTDLKANTKEEDIFTAFPKLHQYREMMLCQPYVTATACDENDYAKFVQFWRAKDTNASF